MSEKPMITEAKVNSFDRDELNVEVVFTEPVSGTGTASDRNIKEQFEAVDTSSMLRRALNAD